MRILIIDGHPYAESFSNALANSYAKGAQEKGHEVELVHLRDLNFDPILHYGYQKKMELEDDLKRQQELLKWCEHLVVVTPIWWMNVPALLKGYFDRVLLPGFAFSFKNKKLIPDKFLKGRSARLIYTQNTPRWISTFFFLDSIWRLFKFGVLGFVGFGPVRRTVFARILSSSEERKKTWLRQVYKLGKKAL